MKSITTPTKSALFALICVTSALLVFQNCSGSESEKTDNSKLTLPPVNYFTEPRPESMCGRTGFNFLKTQYFETFCGGACHVIGGQIGPAFADPDLDVAYYEQSFVRPDRLLLTSMNNQFCGPNCNLDTRGEVYAALVEWLGCR